MLQNEAIFKTICWKQAQEITISQIEYLEKKLKYYKNLTELIKKENYFFFQKQKKKEQQQKLAVLSQKIISLEEKLKDEYTFLNNLIK